MKKETQRKVSQGKFFNITWTTMALLKRMRMKITSLYQLIPLLWIQWWTTSYLISKMHFKSLPNPKRNPEMQCRLTTLIKAKATVLCISNVEIKSYMSLEKFINWSISMTKAKLIRLKAYSISLLNLIFLKVGLAISLLWTNQNLRKQIKCQILRKQLD